MCSNYLKRGCLRICTFMVMLMMNHQAVNSRQMNLVNLRVLLARYVSSSRTSLHFVVLNCESNQTLCKVLFRTFLYLIVVVWWWQLWGSSSGLMKEIIPLKGQASNTGTLPRYCLACLLSLIEQALLWPSFVLHVVLQCSKHKVSDPNFNDPVHNECMSVAVLTGFAIWTSQEVTVSTWV